MNLKVESDGLVRHALELHDLGFLCVPLGQTGRHLDLRQMDYEPVHLKNRTKRLKELAFASITFHLAQQPPDAEMVERWFAKGASNLGIVGGYRDLVVLDFDRPACFQRWRQRFGDLFRATPVAKACRGFHVYLRCRQPLPSSSLHYGFRRAGHVKALGGYITAPPSRGQNGVRYQWLAGQSPHDVEPQSIASLECVSLATVSRFKHHYDRLLKRGSFSDDCAIPAGLPAMQH